MSLKSCVWAIALFFVASPTPAQDRKAPSPNTTTSSQAAQGRHKATGIVRKIDVKAGVATVEHGPVASLKWAGMSMPFAVKDSAVLAKMEVGKKIEFEIEQRGSEFLIVQAKSM